MMTESADGADSKSSTNDWLAVLVLYLRAPAPQSSMVRFSHGLIEKSRQSKDLREMEGA